MHKKMTALFVAVIMLAGCSPAELGYLSLMREVSQLQGMRVTGSLNLNLNKELINKTPDLKDIFGEEAMDSLGMLGANPELSYAGDVKILDNDLEANIDFFFRGEPAQEKRYLCNVIRKDGNWYIDTKGVSNIYDLAVSINPDLADDSFSAFAEKTEGYEYILMGSDPVNYGGSSISDDEADDIRNLIADVFKNFDTGLVRQTDNGYRLEMNVPKVIDSMVKGASYLSDNRQYVYDTISKSELIMKNGGIDDYDSFADNLDMMKESALSLQESYNEEIMDPDSLLKHFKDSYYFAEIGKTDGAYHMNSGIAAVYDGDVFCGIASIADISPAEVNISAPESVKVFETASYDGNFTGGVYFDDAPDGVYEVEVIEVA